MIPWRNRVDPYPKQHAAIYAPEGNAIIEASPKAGKTLGCLQWQIEETERFSDPALKRHLWVAPVLAQSEIAMRRAYQEVLDIEEVDVHKTNRTIVLPSGAVLVFRSGDRPDLIYGEDYHSVVVDEASRLTEDAWLAALSTVNATGGRMRLIGNVHGRRNWAYKLARRVEKGDLADWEYHRLVQADAIDAGIVDPDDDALLRNLVTASWYRELYNAEAADDGGIHIPTELLLPASLPDVRLKARGWDLAVSEAGDYSVGVRTEASSVGYWYVDVVRDRLQPNDLIDKITEVAIADGPEVDQVVEEEKGASGSLFVETLRRELDKHPQAGPVYPAGVEQNKIVRAFPMVAAIGKGRYHLEPDCNAVELLSEFGEWPDSTHDDIVDAAAHAHNHLAERVEGMIGSFYAPSYG